MPTGLRVWPVLFSIHPSVFVAVAAWVPRRFPRGREIGLRDYRMRELVARASRPSHGMPSAGVPPRIDSNHGCLNVLAGCEGRRVRLSGPNDAHEVIANLKPLDLPAARAAHQALFSHLPGFLLRCPDLLKGRVGVTLVWKPHPPFHNHFGYFRQIRHKFPHELLNPRVAYPKPPRKLAA